MSFNKDLAFGKKWEAVAEAYIHESEMVIEHAPEGQFKPWDFRSTLGSYEVKSDRLAYKYGCKTMFIEYECSGNPSGIQSTEADFWMYYMVKPSGDYVAYRIPVPELKEMCKGCVSKAGGDNYRSRGYIVPVNERFRLSLQTQTGHSSSQEKTLKSQCPLVVPQEQLKRPLSIKLPEKIDCFEGNKSPEEQVRSPDCPLLSRVLPTNQ
jgi:hypothetical protein